MQRFFSHISRAALIAALASLAACGGNLNPFKADTIEVACPPTGALKEAETFTRFRPGEGRDLTDVTFEARIGRVVAECQVTQSTTTAEVRAGLEVLAERGPALDTDAAPIEYFVAVRNPDGKILTRQAFTMTLDFRNGVRQARTFDILTFEIPGATPEAMRGYRIFFGLQMTREEWEFTERSREGRSRPRQRAALAPWQRPSGARRPGQRRRTKRPDQ